MSAIPMGKAVLLEGI